MGGTGGSTVGNNELVSSSQIVGSIRFAATDGVDFQSDVARIFARINGTPGANDVPGSLVFATTADGIQVRRSGWRLIRQGIFITRHLVRHTTVVCLILKLFIALFLQGVWQVTINTFGLKKARHGRTWNEIQHIR